MKSSWSGCGDCESFRSCPPPGSASATRAPSPGERRFHGQLGHFPSAAVNHPAPRYKGPELLAPGALGRLRRGARVDWGSPLWPCFGRKEHPMLLTRRRRGSECIGAVRLPNAEDMFVSCVDGFERVNVLFVHVVRGPQNMHDGNVGREI